MKPASFWFTPRTLLLIGVALLTLAVAGLWFVKMRAPDPLARYATVSVQRGSVTQTVTANGTLTPVVLVSVGTQVSGTVKQYFVDFNTRVTKGQILLELEDSLYRAQADASTAAVKNSQAALDLAQSNEARASQLLAKDYIARQDYDTAAESLKAARAQLDVARANAAKDQTNLSYTIIRSPVSGVVVSRSVDVGQTVAASFQTPELFKIAQDLKKMQINTSFAEADIANIKPGLPAAFTVDAFPGESFKGTVAQVRLQATTQSNVVTYNVVVNFDNTDERLLPGMTAYVSIGARQANNVLLLPTASLRFKPVGFKLPLRSGTPISGAGIAGVVYVLSASGEVKGVAVRTGITDNKNAELLVGAVHEGDQVLVEDKSPGSGPANGGQSSSGLRLRMF